MIGITLREVREERGWTRKVIASLLHVSESLINEWEHGRRRITDAVRSAMARKIDHGKLYMALAREATGGPMVAPWLTNIDEHRVACTMKLREELIEAVEAIEKAIPILIRPIRTTTIEDIEIIKAAILESIEAITAAENTMSRLAKEYGLSLAELWDKHEEELIQKGYLAPNTTQKAGPTGAG